MKTVKKVILGLTIIFTMVIAFVIGCVGNSFSTQKYQQGGAIATKKNSTNVETVTKVENPSTYTYAPNQIVVKKGGNTLNYVYNPSVDAKDAATIVAYEYCFGNAMDMETVVNLKSIDTTGVNICYYYSSTRLDTAESITGETRYTIQRMYNTGDKVYIYLIVSPIEESIPTTFVASIVWYYGVPQDLTIRNNLNNTTTTQTVVRGQKLNQNTLEIPTVPEGYYFDAWYLDEGYTQLVNDSKENKKVYLRYHNTPSDWLGWDDTTNSYYIKNDRLESDKPTSSLPTSLIIPSRHNNGINGEALVEYIDSCGTVVSTPEPLLKDIQNLYLSSTIREIGSQAFSLCNLTYIDFSQCVSLTSFSRAFEDGIFTEIDLSGCTSLENISAQAFNRCGNLEKIILSDNITSIGTYAFSGCNSLTSIFIPKRIVSIGPSAFSDCRSLASIVVEEGNPVYDSRENCNGIIETETNTLVIGCKTTTIPNSVTSIGDYSFNCCRLLSEVNIPNGVTYIGVFAFYGCLSLTNVTMPNTVTTIRYRAFYNCSTLTSLTISNNVATIEKETFQNCVALTSIEIPSSVTKISINAFAGCRQLTSLTFASSGTWNYTDNSDYMGGTSYTITAQTDYKSEFVTLYYDKYWYKVS